MAIEEELTERLRPNWSRRASCWKRSGCSSVPISIWRCCAKPASAPGIENYSRHLAGRGPGERPWTLLDYFPDDFLLFVDESHVALPQVRGMYRRRSLAQADARGLRVPPAVSALDNRPLTFSEFEEVVQQAVYVSATPGPYEYEHSTRVVEQIIRPTGLLDPTIEVLPTKGQIDVLIERHPRAGAATSSACWSPP